MPSLRDAQVANLIAENERLRAMLDDVQRYCPVPVQDKIRAALAEEQGE